MKKVVFLLLLMLILAGCAEEVVKKDLSPAEVVITIYFRGEVDSSLYKYYLIFSPDSGINLPNVNQPNVFFLCPGEQYDPSNIQAFTGDPDPTSNISYYYENYFHTWMDVTRRNLGNLSIVVPQGFYPTSANRTIHDNSFNDNSAWSVQDSTGGNMLKLTFSIDAIRTGTLTKDDNEQIYFNFVTADYADPVPNGGRLYDYLDSEPSIKNKAGAQVSEYDASNDESKPAGADIIRWSVKIK